MELVETFLKEATELINKRQFERYIEKYSAKFAKVYICLRNKTIFAGKLFGNKEILFCSSTV